MQTKKDSALGPFITAEAIFTMDGFLPIEERLIRRKPDSIAFALEPKRRYQLVFILVAWPLHIVVFELSSE